MTAAAALLLLADVGPSCGNKTKTLRAAPWTDCAPKGRHFEYKCDPPTSCFSLGPEYEAPGRQVCTVECKTDTDCTFMGTTFACHGRALTGAGTPPARVCATRIADAGRD